jgi:hypothetical protein
LHQNKLCYQFQRLYPQQGWGAELLSIFLSFFYTKAVSPSVTVIHTTIPDSHIVLSHTMMTKNQILIFCILLRQYIN